MTHPEKPSHPRAMHDQDVLVRPTVIDQAIDWATMNLLPTQFESFVEDYTDYIDELRHPMDPDPLLLSPTAFAELTGITAIS